jgi:Bifunctional DNA primase/polymerase, N-terminal
MTGPFARAAGWYASKAFLVFPLAPGSKKPMSGSAGFYEAATDATQIAEWVREFPAANIGIRCGAESNLCVVDIDPEKDGFETEAALRAEGKIFPGDAVTHTRSGGRHIWLAYHPALWEGTDRIGPGIDIRTDGGYIVAPPSIVAPGEYTWLTRKALPEVPAWLIGQQIQLRAEREQRDRERQARQIVTRPEITSETIRRRYQGLAVSNLQRLANRLAAKRKPGRNRELYTVMCFMVPYIREGLINFAAVADAFERACEQNGLHRENGWKDIRRTIDTAIEHATDVLPSLDDLPNREFRRAG